MRYGTILYYTLRCLVSLIFDADPATLAHIFRLVAFEKYNRIDCPPAILRANIDVFDGVRLTGSDRVTVENKYDQINFQ